MTDSSDDRFVSGVVLAVVGTFLFALKSVFIKLAFAAGANPTLLLTLRLLFSLPFYCVVLFHVRRSGQYELADRRLTIQVLALGFFGYYLASYLDLCGLAYISAQLERLTLFTYPAMIAVLAWLFLGEPLTRKIIAAIGLCYLGVAVMYGKEVTYADHANLRWGVFLVMCSAVSYSFYVLLAKRTMRRTGSLQFTSLAMIGSAIFVGVHFALTQRWQDLLEAEPVVYGIGLVLAFVCTVIPSFMLNEAIVRIGATRTSVIGTVGPVITMLLAIVALGEPSSPQHFLGMGIAVAGVSLVARKDRSDSSD